MIESFRIAYCIPNRTFSSIPQGKPYLVIVPEHMKKFHLRSDFIRYLSERDLIIDLGEGEDSSFLIPPMREVDFSYMRKRADRVAALPKQLTIANPKVCSNKSNTDRIYTFLKSNFSFLNFQKKSLKKQQQERNLSLLNSKLKQDLQMDHTVQPREKV